MRSNNLNASGDRFTNQMLRGNFSGAYVFHSLFKYFEIIILETFSDVYQMVLLIIFGERKLLFLNRSTKR